MPTYVNDANDFINKVNDLGVPKYSTLVSRNVKTLYTNITDAEAWRPSGLHIKNMNIKMLQQKKQQIFLHYFLLYTNYFQFEILFAHY